jgi:1-acyl-sn-glycerol-3-phosphate acyltransferase
MVVANHMSVADPVILGVVTGRRMTFMAKEELFHSGPVRFFVRSFGAFPVYRGKLNRDALRNAERVLKQGKALAMFPEGKRSQDTTLQPALFGSALIASLNAVPVVPVGISGSESIKGFTWMVHRPRIAVNIGQPFYLTRSSTVLTKVELAQNTDMIMQYIAELLPEKYRGESEAKEE